MSVQHTSSTDKWTKCISSSGTIRAIAIAATDISQFLADRHELSESGTKALAEGIVAGLLLSSYCKSGEKINLNIKSSGWCQQAIIDANAEAEVRGYVIERKAEDIHLARDVGPWGIGLLSVLRTKFEEAKQPYVGTVPLLTGHLAKDLTFYWLQSEQVHSAVGIEVFMEEGKVKHAEGFLIQALPGATEADLKFIEQHLKELSAYDSQSVQRSSPLNLISFLLENQSFSILEERPLSVNCPCTVDRVKRSLSLIGNTELQDMVNEGKDVEIMCDFCSEKYIFNASMIRNLMQK